MGLAPLVLIFNSSSIVVSLTTLGFGDLPPAVGLPRALPVLEALFGNIFLVTLVARPVTLWVRHDQRSRLLLEETAHQRARA